MPRKTLKSEVKALIQTLVFTVVSIIAFTFVIYYTTINGA